MRLIQLVLMVFLASCAHRPGPSPGVEAYRAAHRGDLNELARLSETEINTPNSNGTTLLMLAARTGNETSVQYLLTRHADANAVDHDRQTVLHYAVAGGHLLVMKSLIWAGADPSATDRFDSTPLLAWAESGRDDLILMSLERRSTWCCFEKIKPELIELVTERSREKPTPEATAILKLLRE